ncbi:MAG TPA: nuclease A inhibitor family protein [Pyrinomonadaceae bacterium]|nr:nuclease A inhibitor family protein [Pyrinomonadaceae bacterium]
MSKRKKMMNLKEEISSEKSFEDQIKSLCEGLYYISETDAEIFPFSGTKAENVTAEELLKQTGNLPDAPVEERGFDEMFVRLTKLQDWFGDEEKATAAKFSAIKELLEKSLKDLKVFKIGRINIDIYFVGLDADGNLKGIQTKAIET